ncbi:hypothetical protein [Cognatilysobacter bugurensis]|uniref:Protein sip-5 n=1 Tax=Cognatilysobacter bugurensis TaxID=543356 RepID=A0A918W7V7_9GAMM|nr:hypothetical protein [Lysobacter bugurensis]GHA83012.1 hypothetical protein GCM10007067_21380 [Lysobacter bugurensis]
MSAPHASDSESTATAKAADPTPTPSLLGSSRAPKHNVHSVMNFDQLLKKVEQAEDALEAREREAVADWRRVQATWNAAWTPGRILIAGLTSGFAFGRASRGSKGAGSGFLRILSTVSNLIASANAQMAAHEAEHVADRVDAATRGHGHDEWYDDVPDEGAHHGYADDELRIRVQPPAGRDPRTAQTLSPDEAVRRAGAESARQ